MGFNRRTLTVGLGILVIVVATAQIISLLSARVEAGDTLPPYSTMRADPMGTMAIYNALDALPSYQTLQYVRPYSELPDGNGNTLILAGAHLSIDPISVLDSIDDFVRTGGRMVIAFAPMDNGYELEELRRTMRYRDRAKAQIAKGEPINDKVVNGEETEDEPVESPANADGSNEENNDSGGDGARVEDSSTDVEGAATDPAEEGESDEDAPTEEGDDGDGDSDDEEPIYGIGPAELKSEDISERWDFDYGFDVSEETSKVATDLPLEEAMRIRTGLFFQADDTVWTSIYARADTEEDKPARTTIIERSLGSGTIVLCSDSYFLSNEALRRDRSPAAIQWLVGDNPTLLFSEVHLGNGQRDRIMTLVRRYRLHGLLLGLALIAGLFIWRNATTLLPRRERMTSDALETEKSLQGGLENLLIRYLPPASLLSHCVKEWRKHFGSGPHATAVDKLFVADPETGKTSKNEDDIVSIYNQISREVRKRDRK